MNNTKLIFIEGIPGSGKSSTAQYISNILHKNGISNKWWYEEDKEHPIYIFNDRETMLQAVDDLVNGNYRQVVTKALQRWEEFIKNLQASDEIIIVDSCFFGYLTWSLFANNVPDEEVHEYLSQVERIIGGCNPLVIYFYQNDIDTTFKKICTRRNTESDYIRNATQSNYGKSKGLNGFNGLVKYWQDYRVLADEALERTGFPKLAIENSDGDWAFYYSQILLFLGLDEMYEDSVSHKYLQRFVGKYVGEFDSSQAASLFLDADKLIVDGLRQVWRKTTLIPRSLNIFDVQSLPYQVEFKEDIAGNILRMRLTGTTQLDVGPVDYKFRRVE